MRMMIPILMGFFLNFYILTSEREGRRERERLIWCYTYLCSHWLILVRALTGNQTCNLGVRGQHSNQLSYLARASWVFDESNDTVDCRDDKLKDDVGRSW